MAAFSNRFQQHELVDVMHQLSSNTHYGLNLPPGTYDLVVFADINQNDFFENSEAVGQRRLELKQVDSQSKVESKIDIMIGANNTLSWPVEIPARNATELEQSLYYPAGTLRQLEDPLFDKDMSTLGMYHPAAFLEKASTMFYALEEDIGYKIPVIFVHGINGSARDFKNIVDKLDRTYYKPWFFHYPSGADLDQMAQFFHNVFLSGKVIPVDEKIPIIVVAHSMGGLIVREALNLLDSSQKMALNFISMATPFGGHPAAAAGEDKGLISIPSWRDLNPSNKFITNLYRRTLPPFVSHQLMYAYGNPKKLKIGENSDGVVPLSSQLHETAQKQTIKQTGFNVSHVEILQAPEAIDQLIHTIEQVHIEYPKEHLQFLLQGGFSVSLGNSYSKVQRYIIRTYGKYIRALVQQNIKPANHYQEDLLEVVKNKRVPKTDSDIAWSNFVKDYPNWASMQ
jgi:pimeloyl-ACP methyl ester carboxylesterase